MYALHLPRSWQALFLFHRINPECDLRLAAFLLPARSFESVFQDGPRLETTVDVCDSMFG